jgi:glycosyltransferase involved in cell wall biosynthesis
VKDVDICLLSPGHLSGNPRLVKEAEALGEAGYSVHVISCDYFPPARKWDREIRSRAKWDWTCIPWKSNSAIYFSRRMKQVVARKMVGAGMRSASLLSLAHHSIAPKLGEVACCITAKLYIGHCLASLHPSIVAAKRNRAKIGFDAEDFHSGEALDVGFGKLDNAIAGALEGQLLKHCDYVTAASPLIASTYNECYGVRAVSVLNVFPLDEAILPQAAPTKPSFYWFSQTIGPGRGLEEFIEILRQTKREVRLDLRGYVSSDYRAELQARTKNSLIDLQFLEPVAQNSMVRHAVSYTAGLGLEMRQPANRNLCLTNKAFTYLLAGTPVILSRTRAQEELATELGSASLLIDLEDSGASAQTLNGWLVNSDVQAKARQEAFRLGRERFNWDAEKSKFLEQVKRVLQ